jgi:hypothetical protein
MRVKAWKATRSAERKVFLRTSETDGVIGTNGKRLACMNPTLDSDFLTNEAAE